MHILSCNALTKRYGKTVALNNFTLDVTGGKIIGLLGPNGSGKTTFLKLVTGLLIPTSGHIDICGQKPGYKSAGLISFLPDRTTLSPHMSVREVVGYFADFFVDFDIERARDMLSKLQIHEGALIRTLSKGTKEKVQLILAMSRRCPLYLLDEPIGGVDPATREYILNTIVSGYAEHSTVIISTHLIIDVEPVLDEVIFIKNGNLILHRPVPELVQEMQKSVDEVFRDMFRY